MSLHSSSICSLKEVYTCSDPENELNKSYADIENISIDHALIEKSKNIAVIKAQFNWQDLGHWSALEECFPQDAQGNISFGPSLTIDSKNISIDTNNKQLVATLGVKDLIIVVNDDAILVCHKNKSQDVKKIVTKLKESKLEHLT